MTNLFVFGDSWPWGAECSDPYTQAFPYLLGPLINLSVHNLSQPATSIDQLVYNFLRYYKRHLKSHLFNEGDSILFCLTGRSRSMYFDRSGTAQELHPRGTSAAELAYYQHLHSTELEIFNFQRNILICEYISDKLNCRSFFVTNWEKVPNNLYDNVNFYHKTLAQILHPERNHDTGNFGQILFPSDLITPGHHPTELGHQKIAKELATWIS